MYAIRSYYDEEKSLASPTGTPAVNPAFNQELSGVISISVSCAKTELIPNNANTPIIKTAFFMFMFLKVYGANIEFLSAKTVI